MENEHLPLSTSTHSSCLRLPSSASSVGEVISHSGPVTCLSLSPKTGRLLATGSEDKKINLTYLVKPITCLASLTGHTSSIESVKFGGNEDVICAGSVSGALKVWDLETTQILRTFSGHKSSITCIDFHPYGDFFASGSLDSNIKLWDTRKKSCMYAYRAHGKDVRCLRFSPDGRWLASGGDEGVIKVWDLAAGNILAEFNEHSAPVTDLAFHPNELLLTSCSLDGTVKFWDLEAFAQVSSSTNESGPMHKITYNEEGSVLFSCGRDLLKCFQWEPTITLSALIVNWGRVKDTFMTTHQMIAASATAMSASLFVVNLGNKTSPSSSSILSSVVTGITSSHSLSTSSTTNDIPTQLSMMTKDPLNPLSSAFKSNLSFSVSSGLNNATSLTNLSSVPSTAMINAVASSMAKSSYLHHSQSCLKEGLRSPPTRLPPINSNKASSSSFTITPFSSKQSAVVFPEPNNVEMMSSVKSLTSDHLSSPASKTTINSGMKSLVSPLIQSPEDEVSGVIPEEEEVKLNLFPSTAKDLHLNSSNNNSNKPVQNVAPSSIMSTASNSNRTTAGAKLSWNTNHHQQNNNSPKTLPLAVSTAINNSHPKTTNKVPPTTTTTTNKASIRPTKAAAIIYPEPKKKPSPPASIVSSEERVELIPENRDHPAGLDIDDFLPKHLQDTVRMGYHPQPEMSETEAMTSIMRGHKSLVTALSHRKKNVEIVLALWSSKDPMKGLEQAIHFDDQSIIVDILNVINLKPSIWNLDVCQTLLPVIHELLQSKYESYMSVGCTSLKLILKNFASMIKSNITAPPGIGVDISREERYNKCLSCYNLLLSVRAFILKRQTLQGKLGRIFRELSILMQNLE